jgi:FtsH-binding integral membrane protein
MSRLVQEETSSSGLESVQARGKTEKKPSKKEQYFERVAKYIPAEIVAAYMAAIGVIAQLPTFEQRKTWYLVAFVAGLIATPLYLLQFGDPSKSKTMHLVISTIAFVVWAYSLKGVFVEPWNLYDAGISEAAALIFAVVAGVFKPGDKWFGLLPKPQTA